MPLQLRIIAIIVSLFFLVYLTVLVKKNKTSAMQIRKWFLLSVLIILGIVFYDLGSKIALFLGFNSYSSFTLFILILVLLLFTFKLQLAAVNSDRQIKTLVQEISLMKQKEEGRDNKS